MCSVSVYPIAIATEQVVSIGTSGNDPVVVGGLVTINEVTQ